MTQTVNGGCRVAEMNSMDKSERQTILIIGAGRLQIPAIKKAKEMGLFTVATDYNPEAYGLGLADDRIIISTRDVDGSVRLAKKYHQEIRPINGVITVGTDASMAVAAVANALGLPGIKFHNAEAASNKLKMRARLQKHNVPCPAFHECWTEEEALEHFRKLACPVVVKPADNMGARGVSRADSEEDVRRAFRFAKQATPTGEVIIEEYMEGPELSIDALIWQGEVYISGIADRLIAYPPYFVETGHIMPTALESGMVEDAVAVMRAGIRALGIEIGAAKGDIKVTPNGARVGEIAARLSGGFMSAYTYPYASGVDLIGNAIRIAIGQEPRQLQPRYHKIAMEVAVIRGEGRITSIQGIDQTLAIPGVRNVFLNVDIGDEVHIPRSNVEKLGHIIVTAATRDEALAITEQAQQTLRIELEPIR